MTAAVEWSLSPADVPVVATLRYAPLLFFGGYLGLAATAGFLSLPALVANPGLLALVALFALVGTAFVFFALAAGASLVVESSSRPLVVLVAGGIGLAFAVAAFTVA